jgi:hypothetical protein
MAISGFCRFIVGSQLWVVDENAVVEPFAIGGKLIRWIIPSVI